MKYLFTLCLFAVLFSGCAMYTHLPAELPDNLPGLWHGENSIKDLPVTVGLLDLIQDHQVKELVLEAMENNPDLCATAKRLEAQGFLLNLTRAQMMPDSGITWSAGRSEQGFGATNAHRPGFAVNWELDLWGKLADEHGAARASFRSSKYNLLAVRDALAARIIQAYIELVTLNNAVNIEQERIIILKKTESLFLDRYKNGTGGLDEFSSAHSLLEIATADLSARQGALDESIRGLEILLGRQPSGRLSVGSSLPIIDKPVSGVPADVLLSRPDIRSRLEQLEFATLSVSAAKKEMLPNIKLSGELFREAATLDRLSGAVNQWSLLGSLLQPLFENGRIRNTAKAKKSEADAALFDLYSATFAALKEVEDAMGLEKHLMTQAKALSMAADDAKINTRIFTDRYKKGLDSLQNLLIAREQELSVKLRHSEIRGSQLINRVNLALALGASIINKQKD